MSNTINVREASKDDFESIRDLNRQIFEFELEYCEPSSNVDYPDQHDGIKYFLQLVHGLDGFKAFVAEIGNKVVGYVGVRIVPSSELTHRKDIKLAQLHTLSVHKEFRNSGIGRTLIEKAKDFAREFGANKMRVIAYSKNDRARYLYREMGFNEVEIVHECAL